MEPTSNPTPNPKPKLASAKAAAANLASGTKSVVRFVVLKIIGIVLAMLFLFVAAFFLAYAASATATTVKGKEAKITVVSGKAWGHCTSFRLGGLFEVTAEMDKQKYEKIYCFYPAWPDILQPSKGDVIQVWPAKQPVTGAPAVEGWGWFIVGTFFVLGLLFFEFAFLVLTIG
ncbi:MAG TPA: hypothetical protein VMV05_11905 [bacterium]|nr:hypothetical protein [bacterium]